VTSGLVPEAIELGPGLHVLENRPLGQRSPKLDHALTRLREPFETRGSALVGALSQALSDHEIPKGAMTTKEGGILRPPEADALCVHAGPYGTRSATLVVVHPGERAPEVWFSDGPPCSHPVMGAQGLWSGLT
jgi:hypothetical protein